MDRQPDARSDRYRLSTAIQRTRQDPTFRREADMMGLTVCIALLAALTVGSDHAPHSKLDVLVIVWGTTLGLALVHWFALTLSVRLVRDPGITYRPLDMLVAQTAMAAVVAAAATVTVLVLDEDVDRLGARITAGVFLAALVVLESRAGGASTRASLILGVVALAIAMSIATVKWSIGT